MDLAKQDRNGSRVPADVERRYKLGVIEPTAEEVEKLKQERVVDDHLSTTSTNSVQNKVITVALNNKVSVETGKGLSTNDFTDEYKNKVDSGTQQNHTHSNKTILDGIRSTDIDNWDNKVDKESGKGLSTNDFTDEYQENVDNNSASRHTHANQTVLDSITSSDVDNWNNTGGSSSYFLSNYSASGVSILRSNCVVKNDRVCINFVGTCNMNANTTTTLFNLPSALRPFETRDFVVFGQSSNTTGYVGYGYVTDSGLLQVRFNEAISSYIRFSVTYDLY